MSRRTRDRGSMTLCGAPIGLSILVAGSVGWTVRTTVVCVFVAESKGFGAPDVVAFQSAS